jgi:hypothetical protein
MALNYIQSNTLYLSGSGVIVGAVVVSLTSFTDIYGNVLTMADFGAKGYVTLEPDTVNEEAITFTAIVVNANGTFSLTGVSSSLAKSPYTETSGLVRAHSGGTKAVITDSAAFWNTFANKTNNEVITGTWTFNNAPVALSATPASTSALGNVKLSSTPSTTLGTATITIASPGVVTLTAHGLIAGDTVQFTTTGALPTGLATATNYFVIAAGLTANTFELALTAGGAAINTTGSQSGVHTLFRTTPFGVGTDDPRLFPNAYGVDATGTSAYVITLASAPAKYVTGQLYAFKAQAANVGAPTLNINGLGAITIVNLDNTTLADSTIAAGGISAVVYDGTSFRLISSKGGGTISYQDFIASGTWTKPTGLGGNEVVFVQVWGGGGGGASTNSLGGGGGSYVEYKTIASALTATVTVTIGAGGVGGGTGTQGGITTFGAYVTAYGGAPGNFYSTTIGGAGAGSLGLGSSNGGQPAGGIGGSAALDSSFGGGGGASGGGTGGASAWGGGGGSTNTGIGGASLYGGGGGGGTGGTSLFGGKGGNSGVAGVQPGGGGGSGGANGGAGELRIWVIKT